eukprot:COSAG06_NODE_29403_length_557_cov_0.895197_2_plen_51_part_01
MRSHRTLESRQPIVLRCYVAIVVRSTPEGRRVIDAKAGPTISAGDESLGEF